MLRLGIDFGTCYSSAAIALNSQKPQLIREPLQHNYSFPSCVYVTEQGEILVGQAAQNQHILHPERYRAFFKRDLGSPEPYMLGNRPFLPEELVTEVIRKLKNEADQMVKSLGNGSITDAVITVPATYRANKRQLMEKAAKAAGFNEVKLLEEPVTAAIYYAQQYKLEEEEIILVYDLGAGTFDATLLQKQGTNYQILAAPVGLSHCGGMDFDREIYKDLSERCSESLRERLDPHNRSKEAFQARAIVGDLCRTLKHQLSEALSGEILIPITLESYHLNRQDFNQMIAPLVEETLESCHQLVRNARINWEQISQVLLVGGSCRIPDVKAAVEKAFNQPPLLVDDPELAVCLGAAIDGFKENERKREQRKILANLETEPKLREKKVEEEKERVERQKLEAERQARIEAERKLKEKEKQECQRVEQERLEAEKQARIKAERKLKEKEEQERQRVEGQKLEKEKLEAENRRKTTLISGLVGFCVLAGIIIVSQTGQQREDNSPPIIIHESSPIAPQKNETETNNSLNLQPQNSVEKINVNKAISVIENLYYTLSAKNYGEAEQLYTPQLSAAFNPSFFTQFERVTVEDLQVTSQTESSINLIGQNTYVYPDGSTQREERSYTVRNVDGKAKITASEFIKVTKSR
ncbi:Heat shock protein 70 [Gloeothece citriformis PCC 7424]|uniref:Heat shock protein 70 n=1 Tax=Gloeothece citriformis (strain PCC 7424) TaxID=65393 RepID=B7KJ04_GLOC7|nr:Hsp70 family protein [Gloeothece citriformis]ACK70840.1 Heat shock protein 70 [Gloeothece citriformis PCC 7424]